MKRVSNLILYASLGLLIIGATLGFMHRQTQFSAHAGSSEIAGYFPAPWPPQLNQPYPDIELIDQTGHTFHLSDFKGQVIIIEPIGMNCPACQAWSGGHDVGSFQGNPLQKGLPAFKKSLPHFAKGMSLPHEDIIFVQLLLYDMAYGVPTPEHAKIWAEHFKMKKTQNNIVAVSPYDLRNEASWDLIPGFQLIDKNFYLRSDSTGHHPKDDLYKKLMPMIAVIIGRN